MPVLTVALFILAFGLLIPQFLIERKYLTHLRNKYPELYEEWLANPPPGERLLIDRRDWRIRRKYRQHLMGGEHETLKDDYPSRLAKMSYIFGMAYLLFMCLIFPLWLFSF